MNNQKVEYPYSWTQKKPEGDFLTVKAETPEEVIKGMDELEQRISLRGKPAVAQPSEKIGTSSKETRQDFCPIHNVQMKERINKKTNSIFYSHYIGTYPNGSWCNGEA